MWIAFFETFSEITWGEKPNNINIQLDYFKKKE